jgi:hypothetical protein
MASTDRKIALGKTLKPKPSVAEYERFEARFSGIEVPEGEVFQLTDFGSPENRDEKWANRMLDERDCSGIGDEIAASIGSVTETVVDGTGYSLGPREHGADDFHTVSVHVYSNGRPHLLAVQRRDDRPGKPISDPTADVLRECIDRAAKHEKDLASAPLIGLEPELAHAPERRLLIAEGISYATRVEEDGPLFSHVQWRPEHEMDTLEPLPASCIFDIYHQNCHQPCVVAIRDLADKRPGSSVRFDEHLVCLPRRDGPSLYFVARSAPPIGADEKERRRRAKVLAMRAAERMADPPGQALRIHEFHHPGHERYCEILQVVDRTRSKA